jgi:hypothetical protein
MSNPQPPIPVEQWGSDHWSTFGYIETRIVDHKGVADRHHMRCDPTLHPQFAHEGCRMGPCSPTRLAGGATRDRHDDWSCLDDEEAAGLLENEGTGLHRIYRLTERGRAIADALRAHKASGGKWSAFKAP